jgi:hypothetical protein
VKKIFISTGIATSFVLPILVFAADPKLDGYLKTLISQGTTLLSGVLTFLIGLAVVWFIWNVVRYAMSEDEGGKEKAKSQMIWGIIAIAVVVSIWGVVAILRTAFGVDGSNSVPNVNNMIPTSSNTNSNTTYTASDFTNRGTISSGSMRRDAGSGSN